MAAFIARHAVSAAVSDLQAKVTPPSFEVGKLAESLLPTQPPARGKSKKSMEKRHVGQTDLSRYLTRCREVNKQCGGPGTSSATPEEEEVDTSTMTEFERERYEMAKALRELRDLLIRLDELEAAGDSKRDVILVRNKIREQLKALGDARKRRLQELAEREGRMEDARTLLHHLNKTIDVYKQRFAAQTSAVVGTLLDGSGGGGGGAGGGTGAGGSLEDGTRPSRRGGVGGGGGELPQHLQQRGPGAAPLTSILEEDEFKMFFTQVRQKDQQMDQILDQQIAGVRRLRQKGELIRDEIAVSNTLMTEMEEHVESNQSQLEELNGKLEKAIIESNKSNVCIYIICCVLLLGIVGAIIGVVKTVF